MIRSRLLLSVAVLMSVGGTIPKGIHHLADQDRGHLLQADSFAVIRSTDLIPPAVRASFAKSVRDPSFSMANPGEKFQETDVIWEPGLPWRRLVFAATSRDYWLLHYAKGGRGHSYHVTLFKLAGSTADLVWRAVSNDAFASMEQLRAAIRKDGLDDDPAYYW